MRTVVFLCSAAVCGVVCARFRWEGARKGGGSDATLLYCTGWGVLIFTRDAGEYSRRRVITAPSESSSSSYCITVRQPYSPRTVSKHTRNQPAPNASSRPEHPPPHVSSRLTHPLAADAGRPCPPSPPVLTRLHNLHRLDTSTETHGWLALHCTALQGAVLCYATRHGT